MLSQKITKEFNLFQFNFKYFVTLSSFHRKQATLKWVKEKELYVSIWVLPLELVLRLRNNLNVNTVVYKHTLYNLKRERYQQTFPDCYSFSRKSSCSKVFRFLFRSTFDRVGNCSSIVVNFYSKVVSFLQQGCNKLSNFYSKAFKNLKS